MKIGLIGNNISSSNAPDIHIRLAKIFQIPLEYLLFDLKDKEENYFVVLLEELRVAGFKGVNITFPFKEKVIKHVDNVSKNSRNVGSANTLIFRKKITAQNTDYSGFLKTYNFHFGKNTPGTILVLGAGGGLGITAIHIAKAMGARVIAAASSQEKIDLCVKEGADEGIIYERDMDRDLQKKFSDEIKELTGGGVDMIYDLVGGDYAEPALRAIARHGKYLVIGFTAGIPKMPLNLTLLKECQIVGVFWGQFAAIDHAENAQNFKELFELHAEGKIKPFVTETYSLEESAKAIKTLEDRKVLGKVVVNME